MNVPETQPKSIDLRASEAEFNRWNMYGEFTDVELYGEVVQAEPTIERLSPNVAAWDKVLSKLLSQEQ